MRSTRSGRGRASGPEESRPHTPHWDGRGLPPVGADILFDTASNGEQTGTVTGYDVWPSLGGDPVTHRVFVKFVYKGTPITNSRLLRDVRPVAGTRADRPPIARRISAPESAQGLVARPQVSSAGSAGGLEPVFEGRLEYHEIRAVLESHHADLPSFVVAALADAALTKAARSSETLEAALAQALPVTEVSGRFAPGARETFADGLREAARLVDLWQSFEPARSMLHNAFNRDGSRIIGSWPQRLRAAASDAMLDKQDGSA